MRHHKECKKHGFLAEEDVVVEKNKKNKNGIQLRCRLCKIEKDRRWKSNHREQHIATSIRWKKENKEKYNAWGKQDRLKDPEKYKKWSKISKDRNRIVIRRKEVLRIHGITKEQHDQMINDQNNCCRICGRPETRLGRDGKTITPLCIDHCHSCREAGKYDIRGLLCHGCNTAIGKFNDDVELLKKAIAYLENHKHVE